MNGLSVKLKVTLWYTALMVLLAALALAFIFYVGQSLAAASARSDLVRAVEDSLDEIEYDDGKLEVDDDLDFFSHGIYLSVYDRDMRQVFGRVPKELANPPGLVQGAVRTAGGGGTRWYVYDSRVSVKKYGDVWVRGVAELSDTEKSMNALLSVAGIALPFLAAVAALGGYLITRRAFRPVRQIIDAAERIGEGRDLSERIRIGAGKDEIHTLANTFNDMFGRLERSFESEKQFTSDASHELRTPVSVIVSQSEYALENAGTLEEAKGALSVILAHARKMSGLISQLLTLSRADRGHEKLNLETLNLSELAEMAAEEQREAAKGKGIEIRTNIAPGLRVRADETMMLRMLVNLVTNAVTYGRPGGHVAIELARNGGEIVGSVSDDGIGIAAEHLARIWERFYQVDPSRAAGRGGVGLGLSMVKWIAEAHGGRVSAASKPGEGSTFTFVLPMAD
jgi:signal transduction histidine kinase